MSISTDCALEARYVKKPVLWAVGTAAAAPLICGIPSRAQRPTCSRAKVAITQQVLGGCPGRKIWPGGLVGWLLPIPAMAARLCDRAVGQHLPMARKVGQARS